VVVDAASSAIFRGEHLSAYAARVIHGSVPALAWRVEIGGKSIVFSGDTNGEGADLVHLAKDADYLLLTTLFRKELPGLSGGCICLLP
jgi:ribonuclease BN (tRNA processing enzyme)